MPDFNIIVAMDQNRGIGKDGGLPWHLPGDLKHFKDVTSSPNPSKKNAVIMGRKTWESLPERFRPLPQRVNVVLTRDPDMNFPAGVLKANSLDAALFLIETSIPAESRGEVFVIGGGAVFEEAIDNVLCGKLYLTHIHQTFDCDVFFPPVPNVFEEIGRSEELSEDGIVYHFVDYQRA